MYVTIWKEIPKGRVLLASDILTPIGLGLLNWLPNELGPSISTISGSGVSILIVDELTSTRYLSSLENEDDCVLKSLVGSNDFPPFISLSSDTRISGSEAKAGGTWVSTVGIGTT